MTNQQPRPDDAVLGGLSQAPIDGVVLGGIEGVRQKLASDNEAVKREGVLQALNYGDKGIEMLFKTLELETNRGVWQLAYQKLEGHIGELQARLGQYSFPPRIGTTNTNWYEYENVTVNRRGEIIQRTPGRARYYREDLGNGVYLDMVYIAGGTFLMGAPASEHKSFDSERPQHRVIVPEFWIGKYQVTQAQWEAITGSNPSKFKGANRPVERVTWDKCQEFCRKLSGWIGKRYRLPSEAEWEYACRAGTTTPFNSGETITTELANYNGRENYAEERKGQYRGETVEIGSFPPNAWGLYDMHGNVQEWCEDGWHINYQGAPTDGSAWTNNLNLPKSCVLRGGSWVSSPKNCRSSSYDLSNIRVNNTISGLRLVLLSDRS